MTSPRDITPDIIVVHENPVKGASDWVVADLHGNNVVFDALVKGRENIADRVFAAGDLIDRGDGNVEIITAIINNNKKKENGKIYCVRGNHEDMCVNAIDALMILTRINMYSEHNDKFLMNLYVLKRMAISDPGLKIIFKDRVMGAFLKNPCVMAKAAFNEYFEKIGLNIKLSFDDKVNYLKKHTDILDELSSVYGDLSSMRSALSLYVANGGQWLLDLYIEELRNKTISSTEDQDLHFSHNSIIMLIKRFIESLPYIIHVKAKIPFNIVHADMPISDEELEKRIADGGWLTDDEKEYAMWARPLKDAEIKIRNIPGRDKYSVLSMTGHTIDGSVRKETNSLNLDVAAYARNSCPVVKMPSCSVFVVGAGDDVSKVDDTILTIATDTQQHLDKQQHIMRRREARSNEKAVSARLFKDGGSAAPVSSGSGPRVSSSQKTRK